ncbi:MAG: hypothetical protein IH599_05465 [Bacteroidales bacterium]|nr:hypothetical protein [Bacteroidales bacterium]
MKTAAERPDEIREILKQSAAEQAEAVVKSKSRTSEQALEFIDLEKSEKIRLNVQLRDAWHTSSVLSRVRPSAYLILPGFSHLAGKLQVLGLKIDTLTSAQSINVQKYIVTDYTQDVEKYEGVNRQSVSVQVIDTTLSFPAGTFVIRMDQRRANLAIEVLEPEATSSFISFDVLHTSPGAELPVYRSLNLTF